MSTAPASSRSRIGTSPQASNLLPLLFQRQHEERPLTVFHVGAALPETVDFFADFRCQLHFVDVFSELPMDSAAEDKPSLTHQFERLMQFPNTIKFDICLFWDIFNYLDRDAIFAFLRQLKPHLHGYTHGHLFSTHSLDKPQNDYLYGISKSDELSLRHRPALLPAYQPHNQGRLKELLHGFNVERNVLLPDSRLEVLLRARL